jgi:hypothetical protein
MASLFLASLSGALPFFILLAGVRLSGGESRQRTNLLDRGAADFDALVAAALAASDSNSGKGHIQTGGQEAAQSVVGAVVNRGRRQAHAQGPLPFAGEFTAAGARLHAH